MLISNGTLIIRVKSPSVLASSKNIQRQVDQQRPDNFDYSLSCYCLVLLLLLKCTSHTSVHQCWCKAYKPPAAECMMMLNKRESFISPALQRLHSNPGPEVTVEHRFYIANQNHSDLSNKVTGLVRNNKNLMS